jgi:predicted acyl esterase
MEEARPFGQAWTRERADDGDEVCADNQRLRLQNPDLVAEIAANPFYSAALGDSIAPRTFVDRITVPVFIAGAWQDEQTGGRFPTMLDRFTGAPHVYATLVNGVHTESIGPGVFPRYVEFLDLYVGRRVPDVGRAAGLAGILADGLFGTSDIVLPANRFDGLSFDQALAAFEGEPAVRVLFEEGAADGAVPGAPLPRFVAELDTWPAPGATEQRWFLGDGGRLAPDAPTSAAAASSYVADPDALPAVNFTGSGTDIWRVDATYDWRPIPAGTGADFVTDPFVDDTVIVGSGSADLWVTSSTGDTDLEVTLTEVRPDGQEMYVQSGWLRASHRALDRAESTTTRPRHTHLEADAAPLPDGRPTLVRVELFPVAHAFRAGSSLRITIDAPGNSRPVWVFDTISDGETVTISHDAEHPSSIVLPVVDDIEVPAGLPACGAVRAQPCREYVVGR